MKVRSSRAKRRHRTTSGDPFSLQAGKRPTVNARKVNPLKLDPTRTQTLRRQMLQEIRRRFARLKGRIIKLVVDEGSFGPDDDPQKARRELQKTLREAAAPSANQLSIISPDTVLTTDRIVHHSDGSISLRESAQVSANSFNPEQLRGPDGKWLKYLSATESLIVSLRHHGYHVEDESDPLVITAVEGGKRGGTKGAVSALVGSDMRRENAEKVVKHAEKIQSESFEHVEAVDNAKSAIVNCNPGQIRGADGRCGPGIGLGIAREDMPQIKTADMGDFLAFAKSRGVEVSEDSVLASELSPTQGEFRQERVDAIPDEALDSPILISRDYFILDGTHRWIRQWQRHPESQVKVRRISLDLGDALQLMRSFPKVVFAANANPDQSRDELGRFTSTFSAGTHARLKLKNGKQLFLRVTSHTSQFIAGDELDKEGQPASRVNKQGQEEFTKHIIDASVVDTYDSGKHQTRSKKYGTTAWKSFSGPIKPETRLVGNELIIVEVPDVRQRDHWSCGAACSMSVGMHFGVGPETLDEWKRLLGTSEEESTRPERIVETLTNLGLEVESRSGMTVEDLERATSRGCPVIVCVQDYGPRVPDKARFAYGHYLVVIGVGGGYVFCQDPSEDNVIAGGDEEKLEATGSIQKPGRIMVAIEDWERMWHDEDVDGERYVRYGITVGAPTINVFCPTGPGGGVDATCSPKGIVGKVKDLAAPVLAKLSAALDKIPGAAWIRAQGRRLKDGLVGRYGVRNAGLILTSGQALSWAATPAIFATTGVPWVPGLSMMMAVPGIVLAEMHHQYKAHRTHNVGELSQDEVERLGRELLSELTRLWQSVETANVDWTFRTDPEKIKAFQEWLKAQFQLEIIGKTEEELWRRYAEAGYKKGVGRAFDDVRKRQRAEAMGAASQQRLDFYQGAREEFLQHSFAQPVSIEKVRMLASRSFDDLKNVTHDMATRMSRVLMDGLVKGDSPHDVARDLVSELDISRVRAETIARTEIIRAHAEGQLDALTNLGVAEVGVQVEWQATDDFRTCPECAELEGTVLSIDEARGMLPRHPNCRCCWIPSLEGVFNALRKGWIDRNSEFAEFQRWRQTRNANPNHDERGRFAKAQKSYPTTEELAASQRKQWGWSQPMVRFHEGVHLVSISDIKPNLGDVEPGRVERIRKAVKAKVNLPPLVVRNPYVTEDDRLRVLDGNHRLLSAKAEGHTHVPVIFAKSMADKLPKNENRPTSNLSANERGSFLATCHRDEHGWCESGGVVSSEELNRAQGLARDKAMVNSRPSPQEVAEANRRIDELGADDYEMQIRGNTKDRAASRKRLLREFGDGETCPCVYCGLRLDDSSVTRDKILTARQGDRYRHSNLVPACLSCNKSRGDTRWENIGWPKRGSRTENAFDPDQPRDDHGRWLKEAYEAAFGQSSKSLRPKERREATKRYREVHSKWLEAGSPEPLSQEKTAAQPKSEIHPESEEAVKHLASTMSSLDRGDNLVHLGDLRDASKHWSRGEFDRAVNHTRRQGKISLSAYEGGYGQVGKRGATERDKKSGIREGDAAGNQQLLLYASLRR